MSGDQFVYFSAVDWTFRRLPHHYICDELARREDRTLFIENTGARWPGVRDARRVRDRILRLLSAGTKGMPVASQRITVLPPLVLPIHPLTRGVNRLLLTRQVKAAAPWLDPVRAVAWLTLPNPTNLDLTRWLRPALVVYFCADEFAALPDVDPSVASSEDELLKMADLVFVTSQRLKRLCSRFGAEPIFVPVGVDAASFEDAASGRLPVPKALRDVRRPIVGYLGGLNHKIDIDLLDAVIRAFPSSEFVFVGDVDDPRYAPSPAPNLRIVTGIAHEEIPAFLQYFDVCLIPYQVNQFTRSVYPAKLNEYLAAGRPVVSTALPEAVALEGVIRIARDHGEFIAHVRDALANDMGAERVGARVGAARANDYAKIIPPMLDRVERALRSKTNAPGAS
jgi:glycosyltransferase involved in cell wall biosynthesis